MAILQTNWFVVATALVLTLHLPASPAAPTASMTIPWLSLGKPFADQVTYPRLSVLTMDYHTLSEVYVRVMEASQLISWLEEAMKNRLDANLDTLSNYPKCFVPERSVDELTGFNITVRLSEDLVMLANLSVLLQTAVSYERDACGGELLSELQRIQQMCREIVEGLANVTGVGVPAVSGRLSSEEGERDHGEGTGTASELSSHTEPEYEYEYTGSSGTGNGSLGIYLQYDAVTGLPFYDRCRDDINPIFQWRNIDELWSGLWFIQLDVMEARKQLLFVPLDTM